MSADDFEYDVFLSHSAKDKPVVRPLADRLRTCPGVAARRSRKDGLKVWLVPPKLRGVGGFDQWVLKPGDSIPAKIDPPSLQSYGGTREGLEHSRVLAAARCRVLPPGPSPRPHQPSTPNPQPTKRLDDAPIKASLAQFLYPNWRPANGKLALGKPQAFYGI